MVIINFQVMFPSSFSFLTFGRAFCKFFSSKTRKKIPPQSTDPKEKLEAEVAVSIKNIFECLMQ